MDRGEENAKKPIYKKWWFWVIIVIVVSMIAASNGDTQNNTSTQSTSSTATAQTEKNKTENKVEVKVEDFSKMSKKEIQKWCDENKVKCNFKEDYSDSIKKGSFISQEPKKSSSIYEEDSVTVTFSLGKKPSIEEKNALVKAQTYSDTMYMSKQRIYQQLTSSYGEGFSKDAAQYAIDNVNADWNKNALQKAKEYQTTMNMSKSRIYNQLTSSYGENFTKSQAQYAIDHLDD